MTDIRAPENVYKEVRRYFPIACVDVVVKLDNNFILTKRTIPPYAGKWCLPGGIIRKGEKVKEALCRVAKQELNINVKIKKFIGVYENLLYSRHDISNCFLVEYINGTIKTDFQSSGFRFFTTTPKDTPAHHKRMLHDARLYFTD